MMLVRLRCGHCGGNVVHEPLDHEYRCLHCARSLDRNGVPLDARHGAPLVTVADGELSLKAQAKRAKRWAS